MKILLVGGTGVLSSEIMNLSVKFGHDVYTINRGNKKNSIPKEVVLLQSDIKNYKEVKRLISDLYFDVIVDFLCYTKTEVENNLSLFKNSCKQYIFISSCAVYNLDDDSIECAENSPLINPLWQYSIDKVESEKMVVSLCKDLNIQYTIIRPAVTYDNSRIPYGIMPPYGSHWSLVARILHKKPILLWDNGETISTITRVEDFAIGTVGLFGNQKAYNQAFNIVGDERYKWIDVINTLGEILGEEPIFVNVPKEFLAQEMPSRRGEILGGRSLNLLIDNSKIKKVVPNFKTNISLKEGLKKTIEYYQNHNYLNGIDYAFDGNIDRIISKYYKKNEPDKLKEFRLSYVDYLRKNLKRNKAVYLLKRYEQVLFVKWIKKMKILTKYIVKGWK